MGRGITSDEDEGMQMAKACSRRPPSFELSKIVRQRAESVRHFPLFSHLPLEDCEKIVALAQERLYRPKKRIFSEGDPIRQVVFLISGSAKLSQSSRNGREVILRIVGPGEPLCVEWFPKYTHCSTAQVVEESATLVWEASQFQALKDFFPILRQNVFCVLLRTLNQLEVRFREVSTAKVGARLSSQLLRLLDQVGEPSNGHVQIALQRRDLAQLTGTTIFTVSRLLTAWEAQGIVVKAKRKRLTVLDIQALIKLSKAD